MFQEQLNKAVEQISKLNEINSADLKLLIDRYPYCQSAHVLYTKKLHEENSSLFEKHLQKTASLVYDRKVLFQLIEKTPLQTIVSAGFEHDEELLPTSNEINQEQKNIEETQTHLDPIETISDDTVSEQPVLIHEDISDEVLDGMIREQEVLGDEVPVLENELVSLDEDHVSEIIEPEALEMIEENNLANEQEALDDTYAMEELKVSEIEITEEPEPELKIVIEPEKDHLESPIEEKSEIDDPIFEMPGYIIERELGKLEEGEEIRIDIKRPVETDVPEIEIQEPVNYESGKSTFSGWLKIVAGESNAKIVGLKDEHKPVRLYQHKKVEIRQEEDHNQFPEQDEDIMAEDFAGKLAQKSIEPDERLVTETYARILFMQGKYAKAIEVYEQLSLKKPSKSDYFAALIEQIKKRK